MHGWAKLNNCEFSDIKVGSCCNTGFTSDSVIAHFNSKSSDICHNFLVYCIVMTMHKCGFAILVPNMKNIEAG